MWWYTLGVLALWVVNPELRRLYDWRFGFAEVEALAALPLVSLIPHVWSLTLGGGWRRLHPLLACAAWIWLGGFVYALLISFMSGNSLAGSYSFATFVFPIGVGLWVAADGASFELAYRRLTRTLFGLATLISIYGVIQYVLAPPWDIFWLQSVIKAGTTSFGLPAPFEMRVFSTLNSPGTFASVLALMLLLALPELSVRKPVLIVQVSIWFVAFGLTLVRTGWLMFAFGAAAYLLLSPRRGKSIVGLAGAAALMLSLTLVLPMTIGNDRLVTSLTARFATLSNLENDESRKARQGLYDGAPEMVRAAPFGHGLGVIGTSTKLGNSAAATAFDSGVLGRAVEMGLPGFILYIIPLAILLYGSMQLWMEARVRHDELLQAVAAIAMAVEVAFAFEELGGDGNGLPLLIVWLTACLAIRALRSQPAHRLRVALA